MRIKLIRKKSSANFFVKLVTKRMGGTLKLCRILPPFSSQSSVAAKVASCPSVTNRFLTHIKEIPSLSSGYCMVVFISDTDRQIEAISISFLSLLMPMHTRNQFVCETSSAAGSLFFFASLHLSDHPDLFSSLPSFADLWSQIFLPQLNRLLLNPFRIFSFRGAFISVPFFEAMTKNNSSASSFVHIFASKDARNFTSSNILDCSRILTSLILY